MIISNFTDLMLFKVKAKIGLEREKTFYSQEKDRGAVCCPLKIAMYV